MSTSAFVKGMSAGLLVGGMVFLLSTKKKGVGRKSALGRAMKNLGCVVEDVTDLLGL